MKRIFFLVLLFLIFPKKALANQASFMIINQIRGNEICCEPGEKKFLEEIKNNSLFHNLQFAWALRFDALEDEEIIKLIDGSGEMGLLLEITPNLAKASRVEYKGRLDGSDWYFARNAFLVGYTTYEKKKIIDFLFEKFKDRFGYYPSFTASWMIDSWSLNYLNDVYKVKLHELTKEQYETDSYTLYGGIFNAPYHPSITHPLIPGKGEEKLDLIIVRQTISDLIKNYGSPVARYTSQPNDYLESKESLNISYFYELVNDVINQPAETKLGVLGFENSYISDKYRKEYFKQLDHLSDLQNKDIIKIESPSVYVKSLNDKSGNLLPNYLIKDFKDNSKLGALWYFGETYRARLLLKDGRIILDDLRIFSKIDDPYRNNIAKTDYAYWIVPYIFDGSQVFGSLDKNNIDKKYRGLLGGNTTPDFLTSPFGITLGKRTFDVNLDNSSVEIKFTGETKGKVKLSKDRLEINRSLESAFNGENDRKIEDIFLSKDDFVFKFDKQLDFVCKKIDAISECGWERNNYFVGLVQVLKNDQVYTFIPKAGRQNMMVLNPIFQPDSSDLPVDPLHSIFYWNNKITIAGRNPLRLFILPLNSLGRPVQIKDIKLNYDSKLPIELSFPKDYSFRLKPWFIDITSPEPINTQVSLDVDGLSIIKNERIEFVPDCKKNAWQCIKKPINLIKYIKILIGEKIVLILSIIQNMKSSLVN